MTLKHEGASKWMVKFNMQMASLSFWLHRTEMVVKVVSTCSYLRSVIAAMNREVKTASIPFDKRQTIRQTD